MVNKVLKFVSENRILEYGDSVILGVSGGADSICMLYVMKELQEMLHLSLSVVHVNHHIRGEEAQRDADYVREVCDKLGVYFVRKDVDVPKIARDFGMSEEEAGRQARYQIFYNMVSERKAGKIAVAHNLNDNSETVLFNLFRGTGIRGMTGIPAKRDMVIRPLLCCTREEIENYLAEHNIGFCTDATNAGTEYSRNKIRLELLPYIKKNINRKAEYNIVNAAQSLEEVSDFLNKEAEKAYDRYVKDGIFLQEGFQLHPALQKQVIRLMIEKQAGKLKDITKVHITAVAALKDMEVSKSINLPYNLIAVRTYKGISIKKNTQPKRCKREEEVVIQDGQILKSNKLDIEKFCLKQSENCTETFAFDIQNIEELIYTKWLDYDKIEKLILRNRQEGDYIVVDDKGSRKKLKDYFINEKVPREIRDDILLLADGSHIVWIIGYRISAYYKVTESTSQVIKVTYKEPINNKTHDKE